VGGHVIGTHDPSNKPLKSLPLTPKSPRRERQPVVNQLGVAAASTGFSEQDLRLDLLYRKSVFCIEPIPYSATARRGKF